MVMTTLMALMMVVIRRHRGVSMLPAACLSAFACAIAVLPWAHPAAVTREDFVLLGLFGTTQFGTGLLLLTIGSRLISATRASLLANLELPLAPLWVWFVLNEIPSRQSLIGGGIVCAAILLDVAADHGCHHPLRRLLDRRHVARQRGAAHIAHLVAVEAARAVHRAAVVPHHEVE
jgi:drug/metabolite transporter (DMT)-like permease